jgi:hypothetical protein
VLSWSGGVGLRLEDWEKLLRERVELKERYDEVLRGTISYTTRSLRAERGELRVGLED